MKWKWCGLMILSLLMIGVGQIPKRILDSVPTVEYVRPRWETENQTISCLGIVYAKEQVEIYFDLPIYPTQILAQVGQQVQAGENLAVLDTQKTKSILANAASFERQTLANFAALQEEGQLAQTSSPEMLEQYQELLEQYNSLYGLERIQQTYYLQEYVSSPISGTVTQVNLNTNVLFQSTQPAFIVSDLSSYKVIVSIPQDQMDRVAPGNSVVITASGTGNTQFRGTVNKIYPTSTRQFSGTVQEATVQAEITLETNQDTRNLKPGYTVTANIDCSSPQNMLTVPYESVNQDENNQEFVYLLENGQAVRQDIVTGREILGRVEVTQGLSSEDIVVFQAQSIPRTATAVYITGEAVYD